MLLAIKFFLITTLYQFLKNIKILLNHGLFSQVKESLQYDRFQFWK